MTKFSDYLERIRKVPTINLIIVGRDPYPSSPTGIPFFKKTWAEFDRRSAGFHVLNSLTGNLPSSDKSPSDFAFVLADKGIVFLNASYHFLKKEKISKAKHLKIIEEASCINEKIYQRANTIILCGDAVQMVSFVNPKRDTKFLAAPHPSLQARNKIIDKEEWDKFWLPNALKHYYDKSAAT